MNRSKSISGLLASLMLAVGVAATSVALAAPVGNLDIQGNARIAQQGSDSFIRLSNTRHAWFSGDRIDTGTGTAILDLDAGANIGFAHNTRAALTMEQGVVRVDLEAGAVLYAIPESRIELVVTSGEYRLTTRPDAEYLRVSAPGPGSFGIVQRLENGELQITVRDGVMAVADHAGEVHHQVQANQRVNLSGEEPGVVIAQIEAVAPPPEPDSEPEAAPEPAPRGVNPMVVGGLAIVGVAVAAGGGGGGSGGGGGDPDY